MSTSISNNDKDNDLKNDLQLLTNSIINKRTATSSSEKYISKKRISYKFKKSKEFLVIINFLLTLLSPISILEAILFMILILLMNISQKHQIKILLS